jgi:hypothetical protein
VVLIPPPRASQRVLRLDGPQDLAALHLAQRDDVDDRLDVVAGDVLAIDLDPVERARLEELKHAELGDAGRRLVGADDGLLDGGQVDVGQTGREVGVDA